MIFHQHNHEMTAHTHTLYQSHSYLAVKVIHFADRSSVHWLFVVAVMRHLAPVQHWPFVLLLQTNQHIAHQHDQCQRQKHQVMIEQKTHYSVTVQA